MNSRVLASVSAATNCRYFFIRVVWSTTVGLGAGTKAMVADGAGCCGERVRSQSAQISLGPHEPCGDSTRKKITHDVINLN